MFVRKSRYEEMRDRADHANLMRETYERAFYARTEEWNALVRRINELGGEDFLSGFKPHPQAQHSSHFTAEDVQRLIQLCHPDKHDGKQLAVVMTQKLLDLKERLAP